MFEITSVWIRLDIAHLPDPSSAHLLPKALAGDDQDLLGPESLQGRDKRTPDRPWAVVNALEGLGISVKSGDSIRRHCGSVGRT